MPSYGDSPSSSQIGDWSSSGDYCNDHALAAHADDSSHTIDFGPAHMETPTTMSTMSDRSSEDRSTFNSSNYSTPQLSLSSDRGSPDGYSSPEGIENGIGVTRSETFQGLLLNALVDPRGSPSRKRFFPKTTFTELITERAVHKELQNCFEYLDAAETIILTRTICGRRSFKKVFSLLALVDKLSDIRHFINENVGDDDLPLAKVYPRHSNLFTLGSRVSSNDHVVPVACLSRWAPATIRVFEEWQWSTLAPTFQRGEPKNITHTKLSDDMPLPFTADSQDGTEDRSIQGGYSTVFKVTIHPSHHCFHDLDIIDSNFAVKRLTSRSRAEFDKEVEMLTTFSANANSHLISLLATYEQHSEYYLIFPWAQGDLQSFWRDFNPNPSMDYGTVLWMTEQCMGIARGLAAIHRHQTNSLSRLKSAFNGQEPTTGDLASNQAWPVFGVHGDIKPQNVLWFRDDSKSGNRGTLKISDFGLAEFKSSTTKIYRPSSKVVVSRSYRPPECEIRHGRVGQSQDIWALGCLYLEMIAWLFGGWHLVQTFHQSRADNEGFSYYGNVADAAFFEIESVTRGGAAVVTIKPAVTEFIDSLRQLPTATKYLHSFLEIIETEMLIIKPKDKQEKGRARAAELVSRLNVLLQNCKDVAFATMPAIQPKAKRSRDPNDIKLARGKRRQLQVGSS